MHLGALGLALAAACAPSALAHAAGAVLALSALLMWKNLLDATLLYRRMLREDAALPAAGADQPS